MYCSIVSRLPCLLKRDTSSAKDTRGSSQYDLRPHENRLESTKWLEYDCMTKLIRCWSFVNTSSHSHESLWTQKGFNRRYLDVFFKARFDEQCEKFDPDFCLSKHSVLLLGYCDFLIESSFCFFQLSSNHISYSTTDWLYVG